MYLRSNQLKIISELLAGFDTGINEVQRVGITMAGLRELLLPPLIEQVRPMLSEMLSSGSKINLITVRADKAYIVISSLKDEEPLMEKICLRHEDSLSTYELAEESDEAQRLFDFIDLLLTNDSNAVFVIDEINQSLHLVLTRHLIDMFQ